MTSSNHTYGPTCHLSSVANDSGSNDNDDIPPLKAQFFYSSPLPIDDPLTAIPTPSGNDAKLTKYTPRPFSAYDNNALEEAWLGLASSRDKKNHSKLKSNSLFVARNTDGQRRAAPVNELGDKKYAQTSHNRMTAKKGKEQKVLPIVARSIDSVGACTCSRTKKGCLACSPTKCLDGASSRLVGPTIEGLAAPPSSTDTMKSRVLVDGADVTAERYVDTPQDPSDILSKDPNHPPLDVVAPACCSDFEQMDDSSLESRRVKNLGSGQGDATDDTPRLSNDGSDIAYPPVKTTTAKHSVGKERLLNEHKIFEKHKQSKDHKRYKEHLDARNVSNISGSDSEPNIHPISGSPETGTTGFPFQRAPSRTRNLKARPMSSPAEARGSQLNSNESDDHFEENITDSHAKSSSTAETVHVHRCKAQNNSRDHANVPVGISRLHLVNLPALQMMPIYWSPVHDIAAVTRGTWFYNDTMYPVEPSLANQLETGYRELHPWSQTWRDELNSAIEVGAVGEEKISYRIWPKASDQRDEGNGLEQIIMGVDPFCAARCFNGEVAAVGEIDQPDQKGSNTIQVTKRFPNSHVIYKDARNAFILKPSLQPSEYYGRKPLAKINRGATVGIHVVRGFNWKSWFKSNPSKKSPTVKKAEQVAPVAGTADAAKRASCSACLELEDRQKVTDLVLVIHGIGQKLSERVESFHFTHAINNFRRFVNIELGTDAVRNVLREDLGGIMVLPVNWRSNLSFEDGGPIADVDKSKDDASSDFNLKDITPDTIPAVRNLISDVMLDIPFYMSHHKPKMIEALVAEANRVYRLWCQNNPEFDREGRVHIIAHSLGSAMALDVLSKQPTSIDHVNLRSKKASTKCFEFDTKNLFFAGSPAGFFLLLHKGRLTPRKGRNKPDAEIGDDKDKEITGDVGTFGCLAVDNLYNVMHYNDPIAYRLNATVDPIFALTLKNAQVPNAITGWLEALGNAMRTIAPGVSPAGEVGVGQVAKPIVGRLPSQLEMEVHDFNREEIAEKKFYLLNDNGQIDYFLSSGGGPLEIQYLNMLSAHSSYWGSPDFVRMLVTEVGRKPGRSNALPNMKVVKVGHK